MGIRWSKEELDLAASLRDFEQMSFTDISKELVSRGYQKRSPMAIRERVNNYIMKDEGRKEIFTNNSFQDRAIKDLLKDPDFLERLEEIVNILVDRKLGVSEYYEGDLETCCSCFVCGNCSKEE